MEEEPTKKLEDESRRHFLRDSSMLLASAFPTTAAARASDRPLRLGLIGCGQRGRLLVSQALGHSQSAQLVAMADAYGDSLQRCLRSLKGAYRSQVSVGDQHRYVGPTIENDFLAMDVDAILIASPTGVKPGYVESALHSGKHVFLEQPLAAVQQDLAALQIDGRLAWKRRLSFVVAEDALLQGQNPDPSCRQLTATTIVPREHTAPQRASSKTAHSNHTERNGCRNWRTNTALAGSWSLEKHLQHLLAANRIFESMPLAGRVDSVSHSPGQSRAEFFYSSGRVLESSVVTEDGQRSRSRILAGTGNQVQDLTAGRRLPKNQPTPSLVNFLNSIQHGVAISNYRPAMQTLKVALETLV